MRDYPQSRWHLDEVFVKVNGTGARSTMKGEVLEAVVTAKRDCVVRRD